MEASIIEVDASFIEDEASFIEDEVSLIDVEASLIEVEARHNPVNIPPPSPSQECTGCFFGTAAPLKVFLVS